MDSGDELDHGIISSKMLEDIRDGSQTHPYVNRREVSYKTVIVLVKYNRNGKERLKATQSRGKSLHQVFRNVVKEISQELTPLGESG